jgi:hypothetical protein
VCGREVKPKQANIPSSGALKGIGYRKIIHEMFKWGQCFKFVCNLKHKNNSTLTESTQSDELFEYLGEFDFIFETNLEYESGDRVGAFEEKKTEVKNLVQVHL